jgi:hypothetical protein
MALVYRNGRPYLYKSIRRDGRVTSEYRSFGKFAVFMALMEEDERFLAHVTRAERKEAEQELADLDDRLGEWVEQALSASRQELTAAGFHQHKRGEWRKRRCPKTERS